ncbi:MAG: hypothetical protein CV088_15030 [Nitrospira sp. LK70]|nr:hypothetical protein [Nitrospira sp. LK70]
MNGSNPIPVKGVRGRVARGLYAQGSKSEREAVFLETDKGRYVLRRKTGPVFGDVELEQYVGREVICDGFMVGATLLAERIQMIEESP